MTGRPAPAPWSARELATLVAIAETIVPGEGARSAALAAEGLARIDPVQLGQLRLVLRLFDSRIANLLLARRAMRFADLGDDARERYLLEWAHSRMALRRAAFQAFKRVIAFVAGADPGDQAHLNRLWSRSGYAPLPRAVTADPTPIQPLTFPVGGGSGDPLQLDADVVIVGSGAGGGVIAAELARAGHSVVVLEAGPFVPEPAMPTNELDAFDRIYLDHGLVSSWDGSIAILAGGTVGGGTTVNWMTCIPPPRGVRARWSSEHGVEGFDGPEMDADLTVLERELGISGPPNVPPKDAAILRGAAALGIAARETRRNGVGCGDCGACPFGCRSGSKQSGLRAHLAEAWRCGARIVPDAHVIRVRIEHGAATGVDAVVRAAGGVGMEPPGAAALTVERRLSVHARQVVVAAGALRTPAVIQRSGIEHPSLGRHLRLHPVTTVGAFFEEPIQMWRGTMQAAASLEYLGDGGPGSFVVESAPGHLGLAMLAFPWESRAAYLDLVGRLAHVAPFIGIVADSGSGTIQATRRGTVRIDYRVDRRDMPTLRRALVAMAGIARAAGAEEVVALGTPAVWWRRAVATPGPSNATRSVRPGRGAGPGAGPGAGRGAGRGAARSGEAGFHAFTRDLATFDFGPHRATIFSAHQMGSARMGASWADHPVDPAGRVRDQRSRSAGPTAAGGIVRGLYVGDASLFPSAIAVNPMITVMTLARRVARTVAAEG